MALSVTHAKTSAIPDDPASSAAGEILPSDWNAAHTIAGTASDAQLPDTITAGGPTGSATVVPVITYDAKGRLTTVTAATITQPSGANPSASIGLTAVNGSAATFMRSDGAPVIDLTAAFAFTGLGNTNLLSASALTWNSDLILTRSGAATLQLGNVDAASPVAQSVIAESVITGTTDTAGAALTIGGSKPTGSGTPGSILLKTAATGTTGTAQRALATTLAINANGLATSSTATGAVVITGGLGVSGSVIAGGSISGGSLQASSVAGTISWNTRVTLTSPTSTALQIGAANSASPAAQSILSQGSRPGTDSNVGGGDLTVTSGTGTGTGTVSSLILQSPIAVASGTGAQTQTTGLTIKVGVAVLTNYTVAGLPAAATAGAGATAFVTDANTTLILGLGLAVTGGGANKVPVYSDGTNWLIG